MTKQSAGFIDGVEEAVFGLLSDIVIRQFEDCVDIPANHRYIGELRATAKQRKAYDQMEQTQMPWLKGRTAPSSPLTPP